MRGHIFGATILILALSSLTPTLAQSQAKDLIGRPADLDLKKGVQAPRGMPPSCLRRLLKRRRRSR